MNNPYGLPFTAIQALNNLFQQQKKIEEVILYGSRAKGNFHPGSDIDLCLIAPTLTLSELLALENQIDDLLLPWKVDITVQNKIDSRELLDHIKRVGIPFTSIAKN